MASIAKSFRSPKHGCNLFNPFNTVLHILNLITDDQLAACPEYTGLLYCNKYCEYIHALLTVVVLILNYSGILIYSALS